MLIKYTFDTSQIPAGTIITADIEDDAVTTVKILNDNVTYAKMQNISAADKLLGRVTSGAGDPEEIACTAAARTVLDDTTVAAMVDTLGGAATTGTGGIARASSPTFITPALGTPASGVATYITGLPTAGLVDAAVTAIKVATDAIETAKIKAAAVTLAKTTFLTGSVTWDPGSLVDAAGETSADITVTGAAFGDGVVVGVPYDVVGCTVTAYVQATNVVRIRLQNESGSTFDGASGTWKVYVIK